jgi:hypothetical protein
VRRIPRLPALLLALLLSACDGDATVDETRAVERAFHAVRDALLQGDDDAFFELHSAEAKSWALDNFPSVRAGYVAAGPEERKAFRDLYRVTEEEFLKGEPRALIAKIMPWSSGWRAAAETFRNARVTDVRLERPETPGKDSREFGVVLLDASFPGSAEGIRVTFVKDPEGWRRHAFFLQGQERVPPGAAPGPGKR